MVSQTSRTEVPDRLLDAAAELMATRGIRAVTMSAIAAQAGVSRMTAYRKYPDKHALLAALFNRELGTILEECLRTEGNYAQRIEATIDSAVRRINDHPLMRSVLAHEPGELTEYMTTRLGRTQRRARDVVAGLIVAGQAEGSVRAGDADQLALTLVLVAQTFVFAHGLGADPAELSILVKGYLR